MRLGFLALLWQSAIRKYIGFIYIDEFLLLVLGTYFAITLIQNKFKWLKYEKKMFLCVVSFYFFGCLSTLIYDYQKNLFYGFFSGIFSIKFFIAYFGARAFSLRKKLTSRKLVSILNVMEFSLILSAIFLIADQFVPLFEQSGIRNGIKTSCFVFEHPTELACYAICSFLFCIYLRNILGFQNKYHKNFVPAICLVIISGRTKAIAFIAAWTVIYIVAIFVKNLKCWHCLIGVPAILFVAHDRLVYYLTNFKEARTALYYYSLIIARDHFPLGAGFGTYGTALSRRIYSPVYYMYNLNTIYGLSPEMSNWVCDTTWPAILGETGILGISAVLMFFFFLFWLILIYIDDKNIKLIILSTIIYLLIESIADSIFMSARGVLIFVILAFMITYYVQECNGQQNLVVRRK